MKNKDNQGKGLIGLQAATKAIELSLHIPYLADERPLGFLFVAQPGTGKSFLLTKFRAENMIIVNDITGRGLENIVEKMQRFKTGYVNIPDLLKVMSRNKGWEAFLTLANIILEEGLTAISRYDKFVTFDVPLNFGIITAMTSKCFQSNRRLFERTGFLSRFGAFSFDYEQEDEKLITSRLSVGKTNGDLKYFIPTPSEKKFVDISPEAGHAIRSMGKLLSNGKAKPFRAVNFVRRLVKANAVMNHREKVTKDDLREVYALIPFFIPPEPISTDLDYMILKKPNATSWKKYKEETLSPYSDDSIYAARQRLIKKQLLKPSTKA